MFPTNRGQDSQCRHEPAPRRRRPWQCTHRNREISIASHQSWPATSRKPEGEWLRRSLCSEGTGQEECGTEEHGPDEEPTGRVRCKPAHEKSSTRTDRTSDGAPASPHHRCSAGKPLLFEEVRCAGRRRDDPDRIISAGREDNSQTCTPRPNARYPSAAIAPDVSPERGWQTAAARRCAGSKSCRRRWLRSWRRSPRRSSLGCSYGFRPKRSEHQCWMHSSAGSVAGASFGCWIGDVKSIFDKASRP